MAHPDTSKTHSALFLAAGTDYIVGSPTCSEDPVTEAALLAEADKVSNSGTTSGLYVPSGALWGTPDIQKMSRSGRLKGLTVTMKKNPGSLLHTLYTYLHYVLVPLQLRFF